MAAMLNEGDKRDLSTAFNKSLGIFYYAKFNTLGFFTLMRYDCNKRSGVQIFSSDQIFSND